jgi:hypothetical protein
MRGSLVTLGLVTAVFASPLGTGSEHILFQSSITVNLDSVHNVHIKYATSEFAGDLQMHYGDCEATDTSNTHHFIGRTEISEQARPERFVWIVPKDVKSGGCLHAFSGNGIVGRSSPVTIEAPLRKRQSIADVADTSGPWFDGVAYMKSKNNSDAFVTSAKNKSEQSGSLPNSFVDHI